MVDYYRQNLGHQRNREDAASYSEIVRWIAVCSILVALVLSYAWSHNQILSIQYQMERLKRDNRILEEHNTAFRAEYSSLINPESIDRAARKLGLIDANRKEVRIVDSPLPVTNPSRPVVAQSKVSGRMLHE